MDGFRVPKWTVSACRAPAQASVSLAELLSGAQAPVVTRDISEPDVKHLTWLKQRLGDRVLDRALITTGPTAYRRRDGIAVVPLALLGP
jgi:hypothetical protein